MAVIPKSYQSKPLSMMNKLPEALNQTDYPIVLSNGEKNAINFSHVIKVLAKEAQSPYQLAGVTKINAPAFLKKFQEDFETLCVEYENRGLTLGNMDLQLVKQKEEEWSISRSPGMFTLCAAGGALIVGGPLAYYAVKTSIIVGGAVVGATAGAGYAKKKDSDEVKRECSSNRRAWLVEISTKEETRKKTFEVELTKRCKTLLVELKDLHINDQLDKGRFEELNVLTRAYKNSTGTSSLTLDGQNVSQFLENHKKHYGS